MTTNWPKLVFAESMNRPTLSSTPSTPLPKWLLLDRIRLFCEDSLGIPCAVSVIRDGSKQGIKRSTTKSCLSYRVKVTLHQES